MRVGDFVSLRKHDSVGYVVGEYLSGKFVDVLWFYSPGRQEPWGQVNICDTILLEVIERPSEK